MIRHIVFFRQENVNLEVLQTLKQKLENLPNIIKEIKFYEAGINISEVSKKYHLALISAFNNIDDLNSYKVHSEHVKIIDFIKENKFEVTAIDYNY